MSDSNSNYNNICCPFCGIEIVRIDTQGVDVHVWVCDLENEEEEFFQCKGCEKFFKARLDVYIEYEYNISKPTNEEIKENNLITNKNKDLIEDCPDQIFMWDDLLPDES